MSYSDLQLDAQIGESVVEKSMLSHGAMQEALKTSRHSNRSLADILCKDHGIQEDHLYPLITEKTGVPYQNLKSAAIQPDAVQMVSVKVAWHYGFMPIKKEGGRLQIAVDYPFSMKTQDEIRMQLGTPVQQVLSRKQDIREMLKKHYGFAANTVERIVSDSKLEEARPQDEIKNIEQIDRMAGDATVESISQDSVTLTRLGEKFVVRVTA